MTMFHAVIATAFHVVTAATYWLLIAMWTFILVFYIIRIRQQRLNNPLFTTLIVVLAIDAFRTLFESVYFGIWYTALAGLLPKYIQEFLEAPGAILVPKLFNVIVAGLVILILLRRWIPEEEKEIQDQQNRELHLQQVVTARTSAVETTNERLRQEIIERTRAVDALQQSEERLSRAEDFSLIMVTHVALDGQWLKVPPTLCQLLGYDEKELLSQSFKVVTHPDDYEKDWQQCQRLIRGEIQSFELEKRYIHRDGHIVWIYLNCSAVKDEEGKLLHFLTYIRDITEHKRMEEERERLAEELRHAQKMEAVGRLAGGVAHEFNNRLMTILGNTEILQTKLQTPEWQEHQPLLKSCVASILRACERSSDLTKQLLAFSRKPVTQSQPVNTRLLLQQTKTMLQPLLGENINFELHLASDVAAIYGNAGQIEQMITNLVLNARDSLVDAGHIIVRGKNIEVEATLASAYPDVKPGPHVEITVEDNGVGMSEEMMTHVFEPFFTTKSIGNGTGLGLATVHGIVRQMGGFITVQSQKNVGTTFQLTLPVADDVHQSAPPSDTQSHGGSGEVILVCEDEQAVRAIIVHNLTDAGYVVLEAENGEEALAIARASDKLIALLITDIVMPGLNGFELHKQISVELEHIQTVFISGYAQEAIDHDLMESNNYTLVQKPFKGEQLLQTVWQVLHQST